MNDHEKFGYIDEKTAYCKHYGNRILMLSTPQPDKLNPISSSSQLKFESISTQSHPKKALKFDRSLQDFVELLKKYSLVDKLAILTDLIHDSEL